VDSLNPARVSGLSLASLAITASLVLRRFALWDNALRTLPTFVVVPLFRGRRIASLLLRVASGVMLHRGVASLVGSVNAQHPDAERLVQLYTALGATVDTSRSMSSSAPVTFRMVRAIDWIDFHKGMAEFVEDEATRLQGVQSGIFDAVDIDRRRRRQSSQRYMLVGALVLVAAAVVLLTTFKKSRQR
jgi:hypothetical protein